MDRRTDGTLNPSWSGVTRGYYLPVKIKTEALYRRRGRSGGGAVSTIVGPGVVGPTRIRSCRDSTRNSFAEPGGEGQFSLV